MDISFLKNMKIGDSIVVASNEHLKNSLIKAIKGNNKEEAIKATMQIYLTSLDTDSWPEVKKFVKQTIKGSSIEKAIQHYMESKGVFLRY